MSGNRMAGGTTRAELQRSLLRSKSQYSKPKPKMRSGQSRSAVVMGLDYDSLVDRLEAANRPFQYVEADDWRLAVRDLHAAIDSVSQAPSLQRRLVALLKRRLVELVDVDQPTPTQMGEIDTLTRALMRSMRFKRSSGRRVATAPARVKRTTPIATRTSTTADGSVATTPTR